MWEGRYNASLVDAEKYLLACYRDIELNPVTAAMVEKPEEYPSYHINAVGIPDPLVSPHDVFRGFKYLNRICRLQKPQAPSDILQISNLRNERVGRRFAFPKTRVIQASGLLCLLNFSYGLNKSKTCFNH